MGRGRGFVCLIAALCLGAACGDNSSEESESAPDGGSTTPAPPPIRDDTPDARAVTAAGDALKGSAWRNHIEEVLSGWGGPRQPMTDLLRKTYEQRDYRPVFLDALWPSEAAAQLVKAVREIPSHGLPSSPYRTKALIPLHDALALEPDAGSGTLTEAVGDNERLAKLEWQLPRSIYKRPRKSERVPEVRYRPFKQLPELPAADEATRCLLKVTATAARSGKNVHRDDAVKCKRGAATPGELFTKVEKALAVRHEQMAKLALLDAMLLQAYYQWVIDFSIDYRVHPFRSKGPVNRLRMPRENQQQLLDSLPAPAKMGGEAFAEHLRGYLPATPEYGHARKTLDRYVRLMDNGELPELRAKGRLEKGSTGAAVEALQERLAAEGYHEGPPSGEFDDATHAAVVRYQKSHQLAAGGVVGSQTIDNLNVPLDWRVKQILLALGRWRESPITRKGAPSYYIRVNLPAFELNIFEEGVTIKQHKVIVGSNRRFPDPLNEGVVWHGRRTKIFDTVVNEVVVNPNWIVPAAIRVDEIEPKVLGNPGYLAEHNFKKVGDLLVQGPGVTNPLGNVKFTLLDTDSIYLHDTDKRLLFREVVRDFSHGCIRVEHPVKLAKFLLARQGVAAKRIDQRVEEGTTLGIKLDSPIPIFMEYVTLGFEEGEPLFYRDLYDYDVAYWKKRTPITRRFP